MKVLANVLYAKVGGGLTYALGQVGALAEQEGVDLHLLVSPWNEDAFRTADVVPSSSIHPVAVPNVVARAAWEQVVLARWAARHDVDVVLNSGNFVPLVCRTPSVMVLQNPNYVGEGRRRARSRGLRYQAKIGLSFLSMRRSDLVVSVSEVLASGIRSERWLRGVPVETVRTGGPAPVAAEAGREAIEALVGPEPYLVSVANDYPHKRLDDLGALVAALALDDDPPVERVVLAGAIAETRREEIRARAGRWSDRLLFLGSVSEPEVVAGLYRHAFAAVSTSEMESWGLTLPEAGARGCPVVATDLPAHREVAGRHARYVEPGDIEGYVARLRQVADAERPAPWNLGRTWGDHGRELAAALRGVLDDGERS